MLSIDDAPLADRSFDDAAAAQMERIVVDLRRMYQERNEALREVTRAHHEVLLRLALAADFRDDDTGVHMVRIGYLAEALALAMGQPPAFARMLRRAAPMHDVGKIGISDAILKKPGGYTPEERLEMNQHSEIGAGILGRSPVPLFQLASEVALTHHERWDGTGYPHRVCGDAIPMSGRIVAVVDFFDALTMDRCYRKAFADDVALGMLSEQRGRAFDPAIVDCFLAQAPALIDLRERINASPPSFEQLTENT
jgi:putative two-component system response regulator